MVAFKVGLRLIFAGFILTACDYNPLNPPETTGKYMGKGIIEDQLEPEGTLKNFESAYEFRDSLLYSQVLDSEFIFISTDYNQTPPQAISWGRDEDLLVTSRLFRTFLNIQLDWGQDLFFRYDPDSNRVEIHRLFNLVLDGGQEIPPIRGEADFILTRKADSTWRIIRWEDYSNY